MCYLLSLRSLDTPSNANCSFLDIGNFSLFRGLKIILALSHTQGPVFQLPKSYRGKVISICPHGLPPPPRSLDYPILFSSKESSNERWRLTLRKLKPSKMQVCGNMFASYLITSQRSTICITLNYYSSFWNPYPMMFLFLTPPLSYFLFVILKSSRICHLKIHYFGKGWFLSWRQLRRRSKRKALCLPPICLKAGHKCIKVSPLLSVPERTEVNHLRHLSSLDRTGPEIAPAEST